ncbi:MAG: SDR family NAD(P)-dependent oxidoreductase [Actinomycetota bacterium]|nr:SDR family NAD(P)-dependent oxidoreductase [Actinomycetota bacterium]
MSERPLAGRVAVVCGASRGIGKGIAAELAIAGAHVVVTGRTVEPVEGRPPGSLSETVQELEALGGRAEYRRCDAADEASVTALFEGVRADHGRVDVLVNSAFDAHSFGASIGTPFWELPLDIWHRVVDVGTKSAYITTAAAVALMLGSDGLIVNVSGRGAARYKYNVAYGVGKAATDRMTSDMALDLQEHGLTVVSLWPGVTRTELHDRDPERATASFGDLDQLETPRYAGRVVVALATDPARTELSGGHYWVAELAARYGLTDEHGRSHPLPDVNG